MASILPSRLKRTEEVRLEYRIQAENHQDIEFFKKPEHWAHIAYMLKKGTKIELFADDGTWYAEGIVTSVKTAWAKVVFYLVVGLVAETADDVPEEDDCPLYIKHRGRGGWAVIRKSDGEVLEGSIQTKEEAKSKLKLLLTEA